MKPFQELTSMDEIDSFITSNQLAFLFLSRPNCSVCVSLLPQIKTVMENYPSVKTAYINTEVIPEVAGRFSIFTVPVLILFFERKEYLREARIVPIAPFNEKINRIVQGVESEIND